MNLPLTTCSDGILLPVQAQPGARRQGVVGLHGGRLKVAVTTAPEKGKATKEILRVLAAALQLRPQQVTLHSGPTNPHKVVLITGLALEELQRRLQELTGSSP